MSKIYDLLSAIISKVTNAVNAIPKKLSELENDAGFITEQKQADWNQNDPTAADYVKNRPFWTDDPVETVLIEEQTVTVGDDLYATLDGVTAFVVGETYSVRFNGVKYECVAWAANAIDYEAVMIGNGSIYGGDGGNGEPFALEYSGDGNYLNVAETGDYAVCVSATVAEAHKIDVKYMPDSVQINDTALSKFAQPVVSLKTMRLAGSVADALDGETVEIANAKSIWETLKAVYDNGILLTMDNAIFIPSGYTQNHDTGEKAVHIAAHVNHAGTFISGSSVTISYWYAVFEYNPNSDTLTITGSITNHKLAYAT